MNEHFDEEKQMIELTETLPDSNLCNRDIYPTKIENRSWSKWNIAALWIGMAVCIPTYMLAASLLNQGMNWWQAILTIMFGNIIVLIPMLLISHPGTKYGIPFPVLTRASFGINGAHIPSVLRSLVACGWFGIQTWIGGLAIYTSISIVWPGFSSLGELPAFIGINIGQLISFLIFWIITIGIVIKGIESIRWLEDWAAPVLIIIGLALMVWGVYFGGGFKKVLAQSDMFTRPAIVSKYIGNSEVSLNFNTLKDNGTVRVKKVIISDKMDTDKNKTLLGEKYKYQDKIIYKLETDPGSAEKRELFIQFIGNNSKSSIQSTIFDCKISDKASVKKYGFWSIFFPALTAMVGFWATLSLNIPDFTRYGKSQKEQMFGQIIGLPTTMTFYSFVGMVATCAGILILKDLYIAADAPWDPVQLLGNFNNPLLVFIGMFGLAVATLSTNLAANVVAPANGFSNLFPNIINFKVGGIITGIIGIIILPWKLIESTQGYIFTWLIGYSALLGPIAGIVISDYYLIRKRNITLIALYKSSGKYRYNKGFNIIAIIAIVLGVLPNIPGFLAAADFIDGEKIPVLLTNIYNYAWFVGFAISFILYTIGMKLSGACND